MHSNMVNGTNMKPSDRSQTETMGEYRMVPCV